MAILNPPQAPVVVTLIRAILMEGEHTLIGTVMSVPASFGAGLRRAGKARDASEQEIGALLASGKTRLLIPPVTERKAEPVLHKPGPATPVDRTR